MSTGLRSPFEEAPTLKVGRVGASIIIIARDENTSNIFKSIMIFKI